MATIKVFLSRYNTKKYTLLKNQKDTTEYILSKYNTKKYITSKTKKSFSLLELSVVIVIISILLATVITSKILIDRAKTNQYFAVMVAYKTSINIFNNTWGFLPGDASNSDLLGTTQRKAVYTVIIKAARQF